jgi:glycosyltransferase involved in cell wall biosynthesis
MLPAKENWSPARIDERTKRNPDIEKPARPTISIRFIRDEQRPIRFANEAISQLFSVRCRHSLLAQKLWDIPFVLTTHSLEPLRPWKVEQLGSAYHLSSWMERTAIDGADAVIAVSKETRNDVFEHFGSAEAKTHVIHNGIDLDEYTPTEATDALERRGVDPTKPFVLFVGRITRHKGIIHLVDAIPDIDPSIQVVLLAGAPDTEQIGTEMEEHVAKARQQRSGII